MVGCKIYVTAHNAAIPHLLIVDSISQLVFGAVELAAQALVGGFLVIPLPFRPLITSISTS